MKKAKVRVTKETWIQLERILFRNYPDCEQATFFRCGWAIGANGIVITVKEIIMPEPGDVSSGFSRVGLNEKYSLKCALTSESRPFAVGLIHSHPEECATYPSRIDDEMDDYFSAYYESFMPKRPFVSLIISRDRGGKLKFSGRGFLCGEKFLCSGLHIVGDESTFLDAQNIPPCDLPDEVRRRLDRLIDVGGIEAAKRLWNSSIAVIGAGGTGSALFHSLLRSCVGKIVIIDPDRVEISNAERLHGFKHSDLLGERPFKVEVLKRLAKEMNPFVEVTAIAADARSERAFREIIECDFIGGCTDSQIGRVLVSDYSTRFLQPAFHVNVAMESSNQKVSAEVVHLTRFGAELPCTYCRGQIDSQKLAQELMTHKEKIERQNAERKSIAPAGTYWKEVPVLHTVGSLTTLAAELVANFVIGLATSAFRIPVSFLELNLLSICDGAYSYPLRRRKGCICNQREGTADQTEPLVGDNRDSGVNKKSSM